MPGEVPGLVAHSALRRVPGGAPPGAVSLFVCGRPRGGEPDLGDAAYGMTRNDRR